MPAHGRRRLALLGTNAVGPPHCCSTIHTALPTVRHEAATTTCPNAGGTVTATCGMSTPTSRTANKRPSRRCAGTLLDRGSHTSRAGICNTLAHFYQQTTPNGASAQPSHTTVTAPRVDVPPWPPHCEIASSSTPNDRKKPSVSAAPFAITSTSALSINPPHDRVMSALRSAGGHGGSQGHEQLRQTVTTTPTSCTPLAPSTVSVTPCATCAAEPVTQQHTMATAGDMSWRGQARRSTRAPRSQAAQPSARVPTDEVDSRRRLSAVAAHVGASVGTCGTALSMIVSLVVLARGGSGVRRQAWVPAAVSSVQC